MHIEHIALYTFDLERLRAFYETYFAAKAGPLYTNPRKQFQSYFLTFASGARLEIMQKPDLAAPQANNPTYGYAHIALAAGSKENVDALTARLQAAGFPLIDGPRTTGDGYYESVIRDPDGNWIEITIENSYRRIQVEGLVEKPPSQPFAGRRGVDFIGVGVGAPIVNEAGELFFSRRGPLAKNERGLWEFPGGSIEFGETQTQALQREMQEEYGIQIAVGELLDIVDHILSEDGQHWISPTYLCTITAGQPTICEPGKCTEIAWFAAHAAPPDLTQITRLNLQHYLEKLEKG